MLVADAAEFSDRSGLLAGEVGDDQVTCVQNCFVVLAVKNGKAAKVSSHIMREPAPTVDVARGHVPIEHRREHFPHQAVSARFPREVALVVGRQRGDRPIQP